VLAAALSAGKFVWKAMESISPRCSYVAVSWNGVSPALLEAVRTLGPTTAMRLSAAI
jgi:hypothetical protein